MDPLEGSSSMGKPIRRESDSETRERGLNENLENALRMFVSMSNYTIPSVIHENGPRRPATAVSSDEPEPGPSNRLVCGNSVRNGVNWTCNQTNSDQMETANSSNFDCSTHQSDRESESKTRQNHNVTHDSPSTSGSSRSADKLGNEESRKRPSSLKLNEPVSDKDDSSDTGNDDNSVGSEDGCVYTYRGGEHLADLPCSFVSLDMGRPLNHNPINPNYQAPQVPDILNEASRRSSPDMLDFLEMDFDPGPFLEADASDAETPDAEPAPSNGPKPYELVNLVMGTTPEYFDARANPQAVPKPPEPIAELFQDVPFIGRVPSTLQRATDNTAIAGSSSRDATHIDHVHHGPFIKHTNPWGEQILVRRTTSDLPDGTPVTVHASSGDLVSPRALMILNEDHAERPVSHQNNHPTEYGCVDLTSALYHMNMAKKLFNEDTKFEEEKTSVVFVCHQCAKPIVYHKAGDANAASSSKCHEPNKKTPCDDTTTNCATSVGSPNAPLSPNASVSVNVPGSINSPMSTEASTPTKAPLPTNGQSSTSASASVSSSGLADASSPAGTGCSEPPRCMVWSEREACLRHVTQIATSACGATAVVNAFIALGLPVNLEQINSAVGTRQRACSPLPRYILSRAVAGCTAADLINGVQRASGGQAAARFFPTHPERAFSLSHWLADWISIGAIPILTLNLQAGCDKDIPDAWHHQMVFGVSSRGIYLCNPVECVTETALWPRLTSPSVLLVRARDVIARFTADTDLTPLMAVPDRRFHSFNVLGQVANVIREWRATGWVEAGTRTRHIRVPAAYQAGITVVALTGTEAHRRLMLAAQLPFLGPQADT